MITIKDLQANGWEYGINKVINADCLEGMKLIHDKSIDLVLTDPPYGMGYQSSRRIDKFDKIKEDDNLDWVELFCEQSYRVLKEDSHIYVFCNEYSIADLRVNLKYFGFTLKRMLVWVKNNHTSGDLQGDYGNMTEYVLFAHKGRRLLNGKRDTNVFNNPRVENLKHPTEKPTKLISNLMQKSSNKGELVLDPFMGSWTTARACKDLGRDFIGFELSEKYCQIGEERLRQEVMF
ncbi:site-specific DNA-methyltransferase [Candidatus Woesebacteria bacterium]|nr:site-specific DNA-methyltransferase [Candidatus Woesebacteria bacterium]